MPHEVFVVTVPARARYLGAMRVFFQRVLEDFFHEEAKMEVLALDESCSNLLKHGSCQTGEPLRVEMELGEGGVRFRIQNFCSRTDVSRIRPRDLGDIRPGGLGTHFIDRIMDQVSYEADPDREGRVSLVLEKAFPGETRHGREA